MSEKICGTSTEKEEAERFVSEATIDGIVGHTTEGVYEDYLEWCDGQGIEPMHRKAIVHRICEVLPVEVRYIAKRGEGRVRTFVKKDEKSEHKRGTIWASPEKGLSYDRYCEVSRSRVEIFLQHPQGSWDGWTYKEVYDAYVKVYSADPRIVPLAEPQFKRMFSLLWSDAGGRTKVVNRDGRAVRVLASPPGSVRPLSRAPPWTGRP